MTKEELFQKIEELETNQQSLLAELTTLKDTFSKAPTEEKEEAKEEEKEEIESVDDIAKFLEE